ncbi:MAG: DMT family transporter [Bdellovibrionia bacterium]
MATRPILILFSISIFVLSQAAVLVRWSQLPVDAIGFWRMALTVPILFVWSWHAGHLKRSNFSDLATWARIVACAVLLFAHWRLWFMAVERTTVANATVCFALSPLLTAVGALVFFREPITARLITAIALGLAGLCVMLWGEFGTIDASALGSVSGRANEGDILGFLSVGCFAGYILVSKSLRTRLPNLVFTFCTYSVVGIGFAGTMIWTATPWANYAPHSWIALVGLTLGPTLLGHAAFTYCLNYLNVNFMTCATLLEPIFAAVTAAWLFGEPIKPATVAAFVLVSAGVLIVYGPNLNFRMKPLTGRDG